MRDITRLLRRAARREAFNRLLNLWALSVIVITVVLLVALLTERLLALEVRWMMLIGILAAIGCVVPLVWTIARWPSRLHVAEILDERGQLRTTLSTAVDVEHEDDAWSRAVLDHARGVSQRVSVRTTLPIGLPRRLRGAVLAPLALLVAHFALPQFDLLARDASAQDLREQQDEIEEALSQAEDARKTIETAVETLGLDDTTPDVPQPAGAEADKPESPEAIRKAAIRDLTELGERLREMRSGTRGETLDTLEQRLRRLRTSGDGPLDEMMRSLQRGEISDAREQLRSVIDDLDMDSLSPEQRQRLSEQLESLAEQLGKLAQQQDQLDNQLREMGINPSDGQNPMSVQDAIEQAQGLTQEQRERLMNQLQSMQQTQSLLQQMQQAAQNACESNRQSQNSSQMNQRQPGEQGPQSQPGEPGPPGQQGQPGEQQGQPGQQGQSGGSGLSPQDAMQQLDDALAQMEMLQQEIQMLDAAQQEVWGQMSDLSSSLGEDPNPGDVDMLQLWDRQGTPRGRGSGGAPEGARREAQFSLTRQRAIGQDHGGATIASRFVQGEQVRGESTAEFREVVQASAENASEAIESQRIPREYHDVIKHYFGRLEGKVDPESQTQDTSPSDEESDPNEQ
ncbi:MAG: hypothetical protein ACF8GE_08630 [Phycisphaerales bacterium JB043]